MKQSCGSNVQLFVSLSLLLLISNVVCVFSSTSMVAETNSNSIMQRMKKSTNQQTIETSEAALHPTNPHKHRFSGGAELSDSQSAGAVSQSAGSSVQSGESSAQFVPVASPAPAPSKPALPTSQFFNAPVSKNPGEGDVTVSSNSLGNNIAIRNTNNVILNGGAPSGPPQAPAAAATPGGLSGKQNLQEQADEQKTKQALASQLSEQQVKQTQIQLDPKFLPFGGDYQDPGVLLYKTTVCVLFGLARGPTGMVGVLPPTCRPKARLVFSVLQTNKPARVDVLPDGRIYIIAGGGGDGWLSFNGISFSVDTNTQMTLSSSWTDFGGDFRVNSLTLESGVCFVSGLIRGSNWGTLGQVTKDCFPDAVLIFSVNNHDLTTRIDMQTNGYFNYAGGAANNGWASLDGIVFTKTGGMPLTLMNNWANYGSGFRGAKYERAGDICILSGLVRNTGTWPSLITTLPADCRPAKRMVFGGNVQSSSARVDLLPDGSVLYVTGKQAWDWISLSNIHFPASQ